MRKDFSRLPGEHIVTWLLRCWDNGANSLELEDREARQLGSLSREGGIDTVIRKKTQALSLWRRLLSGMRERYPLSEDVVCHPSKWTTMERGIQYLRELAVRKMIYHDLDNAQLPTDPDEIQCTRPMWRKFVQSAPLTHANSLAVMEWKGEEGPMVNEVAARLQQYEESLSSPLISAVEKLSWKVQQENVILSTCIGQHLSY
ncbi:ubiquitin carboxyl-terminal hydrolase 4 [Limosa lapponica baueri]|uniref:Ubiquitin carboxyl-terminal hydrolase 4 n=1 Tax=Limosa lapponica baueri TaxID=1758121 RepID=A0A2I0T683_LIMLA|nr:ubiquitin carboxyl-terminal hydrolase 4 [Limosa lapponica baueri]